MEKRQIACVIMAKRHLRRAMTKKKRDSMCYHGKKSACTITEKREIACVIMENKQLARVITEKNKQRVLSCKKDR